MQCPLCTMTCDASKLAVAFFSFTSLLCVLWIDKIHWNEFIKWFIMWMRRNVCEHTHTPCVAGTSQSIFDKTCVCRSTLCRCVFTCDKSLLEWECEREEDDDSGGNDANDQNQSDIIGIIFQCAFFISRCSHIAHWFSLIKRPRRTFNSFNLFANSVNIRRLLPVAIISVRLCERFGLYSPCRVFLSLEIFRRFGTVFDCKMRYLLMLVAACHAANAGDLIAVQPALVQYDVPQRQVLYSAPAVVHGQTHLNTPYIGTYAVQTSPAVHHNYHHTQTHPVGYGVRPVSSNFLLVDFSSRLLLWSLISFWCVIGTLCSVD